MSVELFTCDGLPPHVHRPVPHAAIQEWRDQKIAEWPGDEDVRRAVEILRPPWAISHNMAERIQRRARELAQELSER